MAAFQPENSRIPDHLPLDLEGLRLPTREVHDLFESVMQMRQARPIPLDDPEMADLVDDAEDLVLDILTELLHNGKELHRKFSLHTERAYIEQNGCVYILLDIVDPYLRTLVPVCECDDETPPSAKMEAIGAATRLLITVDPKNALTTTDPRYLISPIFSNEAYKELLENFSVAATELNSKSADKLVTHSSDLNTTSYLMRRLIDDVKFQLLVRQQQMPSDNHSWVSDVKKVEVQRNNQVSVTIAVDEFEAKRGFNPALRDVIAKGTHLERHRFLLVRNQFGFVNLMWLGIDQLGQGNRDLGNLGEAAQLN